MTGRRRPNGTGSIRNRGTGRDPRWFAYTWIQVDGQRRQISRGPFDRKADAEQWLSAELRLARDGRATMPTRSTVEEVLTQWLDAVSFRLAATTSVEYRRQIALLVPLIGQIKLVDLQPAQISKALGVLRQQTPSGRQRSETSILHALTTLHTALAWAVKQRLIPHNPASDVDRPQRNRVEMRTWSAEELAAFLRSARADRLYPLFHLAAYTGMRRSELLGLKWADVDLESRLVSVRRARTRVGQEMVESARTKTRAGTRVVDIDGETAGELLRWLAVQDNERETWGSAYVATNYVFTQEDGQPVHADQVAKRFARLVQSADVPRIRFHDLRHTHASLLLAAGVPVLDVARRIGHASAAMTLDVYGHVVPGQGQRAASTFLGLLSDVQAEHAQQQKAP